VLADLRKKIQVDRQEGQIPGKHSQRDTAVIVNIYLKATGRTNRGDLYKLTALGNHCAAITRRYLRLLFTLTDIEERIV